MAVVQLHFPASCPVFSLVEQDLGSTTGGSPYVRVCHTWPAVVPDTPMGRPPPCPSHCPKNPSFQKCSVAVPVGQVIMPIPPSLQECLFGTHIMVVQLCKGTTGDSDPPSTLPCSGPHRAMNSCFPPGQASADGCDWCFCPSSSRELPTARPTVVGFFFIQRVWGSCAEVLTIGRTDNSSFPK